MNDIELQQLVKKISLKHFEKPFLHEAYFNHRLRTTGGRYLLKTNNIEINKKYLDYFGMAELVGIIKHELCHYHLHLEGRGYRHRDRDFKELADRVNAPRFCQELPGARNKPTQITHKYICTNCKTAYNRRRRMDTSKYVCGKCKGVIYKVSSKE